MLVICRSPGMRRMCITRRVARKRPRFIGVNVGMEEYLAMGFFHSLRTALIARRAAVFDWGWDSWQFWRPSPSQRSPHNAPIFCLSRVVATRPENQCVFVCTYCTGCVPNILALLVAFCPEIVLL